MARKKEMFSHHHLHHAVVAHCPKRHFDWDPPLLRITAAGLPTIF